MCVPTDLPLTAVRLEVLEDLVDALGDVADVIDVVEHSLELLPGRLAELWPDGSEAGRRAAHTLKSSARLLGAERLAVAAESYEAGEAGSALVTREAQAAAAAWRQWLAGVATVVERSA